MWHERDDFDDLSLANKKKSTVLEIYDQTTERFKRLKPIHTKLIKIRGVYTAINGHDALYKELEDYQPTDRELEDPNFIDPADEQYVLSLTKRIEVCILTLECLSSIRKTTYDYPSDRINIERLVSPIFRKEYSRKKIDLPKSVYQNKDKVVSSFHILTSAAKEIAKSRHILSSDEYLKIQTFLLNQMEDETQKGQYSTIVFLRAVSNLYEFQIDDVLKRHILDKDSIIILKSFVRFMDTINTATYEALSELDHPNHQFVKGFIGKYADIAFDSDIDRLARNIKQTCEHVGMFKILKGLRNSFAETGDEWYQSLYLALLSVEVDFNGDRKLLYTADDFRNVLSDVENNTNDVNVTELKQNVDSMFVNDYRVFHILSDEDTVKKFPKYSHISFFIHQDNDQYALHVLLSKNEEMSLDNFERTHIHAAFAFRDDKIECYVDILDEDQLEEEDRQKIINLFNYFVDYSIQDEDGEISGWSNEFEDISDIVKNTDNTNVSKPEIYTRPTKGAIQQSGSGRKRRHRFSSRGSRQEEFQKEVNKKIHRPRIDVNIDIGNIPMPNDIALHESAVLQKIKLFNSGGAIWKILSNLRSVNDKPLLSIKIKGYRFLAEIVEGNIAIPYKIIDRRDLPNKEGFI